jgi:serine/threonine protein kinase/GTPase SAR1 family protein
MDMHARMREEANASRSKTDAQKRRTTDFAPMSLTDALLLAKPHSDGDDDFDEGNSSSGSKEYDNDVLDTVGAKTITSGIMTARRRRVKSRKRAESLYTEGAGSSPGKKKDARVGGGGRSPRSRPKSHLPSQMPSASSSSFDEEDGDLSGSGSGSGSGSSSPLSLSPSSPIGGDGSLEDSIGLESLRVVRSRVDLRAALKEVNRVRRQTPPSDGSAGESSTPSTASTTSAPKKPSRRERAAKRLRRRRKRCAGANNDARGDGDDDGGDDDDDDDDDDDEDEVEARIERERAAAALTMLRQLALWTKDERKVDAWLLEPMKRIANNDDALVKLALPGAELTQRQVQLLQLALLANNRLQKLRLSEQGLKNPTTGVSALCNLSEAEQRGTSVASVFAASAAAAAVAASSASSDGSGSGLDAPLRSFQLSILDLSNNSATPLMRLPESLGMRLVHVQELLLGHNHLSYLPDSICCLQRLRVLDVSHNKLVALPDSLQLCKTLERLLANHNKLSTVPSYLLALEHLVEVKVDHNPIKSMPKEVYQRGDMHLLAFLRQALDGTKQTYRTRLMLVGQGDVGKTSLLGALVHQAAKRSRRTLTTLASSLVGAGGGDDEPATPKGTGIGGGALAGAASEPNLGASAGGNRMLGGAQASSTSSVPPSGQSSLSNTATDGVSVFDWRVKTPLLPGDARLEFSAWDFAGQDVYYNTHALFLSHRALYLVCFNLLLPFEEQRIEYWLQSVQVRAPDAPIIVVGTHADDKRCTPDYVHAVFERLRAAAWFRRRASSVKSVLAVGSVGSGAKGVEALRNAIINTAIAQSYMPEEVPLAYLDIEQKLRALRPVLQPPVLTGNQLVKMLSASHIRAADAKQAMLYLHDLGIIVRHEPPSSTATKAQRVAARRRRLRQLKQRQQQRRAHLLPTSAADDSADEIERQRLKRRRSKRRRRHRQESGDVAESSSSSSSSSSDSDSLSSADDDSSSNSSDSDDACDGLLTDRSEMTLSRGAESGQPFVVMDPQWIVDMLATIVTVKQNFVHNGVLEEKHLIQIWREPKYPRELHPFMLDLLCAFEVVYRWNDSIFVPCMVTSEPDLQHLEHLWPQDCAIAKSSSLGAGGLSAAAPKRRSKRSKREKRERASIGRIYQFEFLPIGMFNRMVVRFLQQHSWSPLLYWRDGMVLGKGSTRALVLLDGVRHELTILVRGKRRALELLALVNAVDALVNDSLSIDYSVFAPCTHCLDRGVELGDVTRFRIEELERAFIAKRAFVVCSASDKPINLQAVAPDLGFDYAESLRKIELGELDIGAKLADGSFAEVLSGMWQQRPVAIKRMVLPETDDTDAQRVVDVWNEFRSEVMLMSSMQHDNLVSLYGIVLEPFCIVLEFMDGGTLFDCVHDQVQALNWDVRLRLALDVARAMNYLHDVGLIHRDLKSPNVLLTTSNVGGTDGSVRLLAKVADFGLARRTLLVSAFKENPVDNPTWLAPEILRKEPYCKSSDVYAFGVMLYEILARRQFLDDEFRWTWERADAVIAGRRPSLPPLPAPFTVAGSVMRRCWAQRPEKRPSFAELVPVLEQFVATAENADPEVLSLYALPPTTPVPRLSPATGGRSGGGGKSSDDDGHHRSGGDSESMSTESLSTTTTTTVTMDLSAPSATAAVPSSSSSSVVASSSATSFSSSSSAAAAEEQYFSLDLTAAPTLERIGEQVMPSADLLESMALDDCRHSPAAPLGVSRDSDGIGGNAEDKRRIAALLDEERARHRAELDAMRASLESQWRTQRVQMLEKIESLSLSWSTRGADLSERVHLLGTALSVQRHEASLLRSQMAQLATAVGAVPHALLEHAKQCDIAALLGTRPVDRDVATEAVEQASVAMQCLAAVLLDRLPASLRDAVDLELRRHPSLLADVCMAPDLVPSARVQTFVGLLARLVSIHETGNDSEAAAESSSSKLRVGLAPRKRHQQAAPSKPVRPRSSSSLAARSPSYADRTKLANMNAAAAAAAAAAALPVGRPLNNDQLPIGKPVNK